MPRSIPAYAGERKRPPPRSAWRKGQSGNPGGRPREVKHVRDLARQHTETAIATLVQIINDTGERGAARARAAEVILDRAWGRSAQAMEISGPDKQPLEWRQARDELQSLIAGLVARKQKATVAGEPQ